MYDKNSTVIQKYYFSTRDLVIIAVLSSVGGVMSVFIGYLGNLVNSIVGTPFGAGQFLAGLHLFWIVISYGLIRKTGSPTLTGLIKGLVELFMGSTHGIAIVLVSGVEGLLFDVGMIFADNKKSYFFNCLSAGFASASNVLIFQILFFRSVPLEILTIVWFVAFISGIFFGGAFGLETLNLIIEASVIPSLIYEIPLEKPQNTIWKRLFKPRLLMTIGVLFLLVIWSTFYFVTIYQAFQDPYSISVNGRVNKPYTFRLSDFNANMTTIEAELKGDYTYVAAKNYTGVLLASVIDKAEPKDGASQIKVTAKDGYWVDLSLLDTYNNSMLLIKESSGIRLIAGSNFEGAYWVRNVVKIQVL